MNRNLRRQLSRNPSLETLESRKLLHAAPADFYSLAAIEPPQTAEQWAELFIRNYESQRGWSPTRFEPQLEKFDSQADALATLSTMAADYWQGLFGKELNPEALNPIYDYHIPLAPGILDQIQLDATTEPLALSIDSNSGYRANVQVLGVDEQDLVEFSDDGFMFVSRGNKIEIFDVSDIDDVAFVHSFDTIGSQGMYLTGTRLVSVSWSHVEIYDVGNKTSPELVTSFELGSNSWISSSRLVDGQLVVIASGTNQIPPPKLIPVNTTTGETSTAATTPSQAAASMIGRRFSWLPDGPLGRFETQDEYLSRVGSLLVASFLPDIRTIHSDGSQPTGEPAGEFNDLGDWNDLALGTIQFSSSQLTTFVIDVESDTPTLRDSETIHGTTSGLIYADVDSIYIVNSSWDWPDNAAAIETSNIFRVSIVNQGAEVVADALGSVAGNIRNSRMMDEFEGDLRVVTNATNAARGNVTSLFVLRAGEDSQLEVVGSLTDIIDDQVVFAAHFDGERAFLTTAEVQNMIPLFDPLHGIDLSDPTRPVEMSELEIPGVATHLQRIDSNHVVSIGYQEVNDNWYRQVSLYNVSDIANPTLVVNWTSDYEVNPDFQGWNFSPLSIHYDASTGILIVPENQAQATIEWSPWWGIPATIEPATILPIFWNQTQSRGALVFDIDVTQSAASLNYLGTVLTDAMVQRGYVDGDSIVTIGPDSIAVTSLTDLSDSTIIVARPSQLTSDEFLVYGDDSALRSENIATGLLTLRSQSPQTSGTDVNGDNATNAMDALIIVNYINQSGSLRTANLAAETSSRYDLDLNDDGAIGAADVLQIVNLINANNPLTTTQTPALKAEGEDVNMHGIGMNQRAVDSVFAQTHESFDWSSWPSPELFFKRHTRAL